LEDTPRKVLTNWVYQLVDQGLLERTADDRPVLRLTDGSWQVMRGERNVLLTRPRAKKVRKTRADAESWEGVDRGLFEHLRGVRRELAKERGVPPYVIFGDVALRDMARQRPGSPQAFRRVHGVGIAKLTQFGERFIEAIRIYCLENGLAVGEEAEGGEIKPGRKRAKKVSRSKEAAFDLFAKGASIDNVVTALGRSRSTVANYLGEFIGATKPASIDTWVDDSVYCAVAEAAGDVGLVRLKPIFERLNGKVGYDEIRLVTAHLAACGDFDT
jgi:ATP-dependent DNA helicase RecQ